MVEVVVRVKLRLLWAPSLAVMSGRMPGATDWICWDYADEERLIGGAALPSKHGGRSRYMHKVDGDGFELWRYLKCIR